MNYRLLIAAIFAVPTAGFVLGSARLRWDLFCLGVISIGLGYRSVHLGYWAYVVPFEIIVWLLWIVLAVRGDTRLGRGTLPPALLFPIGWAVLRGVGTFLATGMWDEVLAWSLPFVIGLPMFVVTCVLVRGVVELRVVMRLLIAVSFGMSSLALLEYRVPNLHSTLPWLFTSPDFIAQGGFVRASFSYFGYPAAAAIVTWGAVIAYEALLTARSAKVSLGLGLVFVIDVLAVYVSGQRSSWLALALAILIIGFRCGLRGHLLTAGVALVLTATASGTFWARASTITEYVRSGSTTDTSMIQRLDRWADAWSKISDNPLIGSGYGQWLAHNVPLEIGRTIGLIPAFVFTVWLILVVIRTLQLAVASPSLEARRYGWLFLALAVLWTTQLAVETVFSTSSLAAPHWLLICLTWHVPAIMERERLAKKRFRQVQYPSLAERQEPTLHEPLTK